MSKPKQDFKYWMKVLRGEVKLNHRELLSTPSGSEHAYFYLRSLASEHIDELIKAFQEETDPDTQRYLLELIGDARSLKAVPIFAECLQGSEEPLWSWAIYGLLDLGTREARKILWEAKSYTKATPDLTEHFRSLVEQGNPTYTITIEVDADDERFTQMINASRTDE